MKRNPFLMLVVSSIAISGCAGHPALERAASGIFADVGMNYQDMGETRREFQTVHTEHDGVIEDGGTWANVSSAQNPYVRAGLGYEATLEFGHSRIVLDGEAWHNSSIATGNDRGVNGVGFSARIFPFARR